MKEGEKINKQQLKKKWEETLDFYDFLIGNNHKLRPMRFLVRHIIESNFDEVFYPGTSMYSLAISIPVNQRIDYTKALSVSYDYNIQKVEFKYWNCKRGERTKENLVWTTECEATEINDTLDFFLSENNDWLLKNKSK
ncbi:MAG: hypothetical protein HRT73_16415 [Flavobacteriales bacterium]|nr:hypothetical protein [Flavobacteriales bacterium]